MAATSTGREEDNMVGLDDGDGSHGCGVDVTGQETDIFQEGRCQAHTQAQDGVVYRLMCSCLEYWLCERVTGWGRWSSGVWCLLVQIWCAMDFWFWSGGGEEEQYNPQHKDDLNGLVLEEIERGPQEDVYIMHWVVEYHRIHAGWGQGTSYLTFGQILVMFVMP